MNEKKKLGQEPAMPAEYRDMRGVQMYEVGMTTRLLIAKDAMCALISAHNNIEADGIDNNWIVKTALNITDELLKQEVES